MPLPLRVLFLCTGNSCRSVIAEALANELGRGRLKAFSAGSDPTGAVNPGALAVLSRHGYGATGFSSKSWDDFRDAPLDLVITVCGNAEQQCPVWLGHAVKAHWGLEDPAKVAGDPATVEAAFEKTFHELKARMEALAALPLEHMEADALADALARVHRDCEALS